MINRLIPTRPEFRQIIRPAHDGGATIRKPTTPAPSDDRSTGSYSPDDDAGRSGGHQ